MDQYAACSPDTPTFGVQPPTPIAIQGPYANSSQAVPHPLLQSSAHSYRGSPAHSPALSASNHRHHPYGPGPSSRSRSNTTHSDFSGISDSDVGSMDLDFDELESEVYASSVGSIGPHPDFSFGTNAFPLAPPTSAKPTGLPAGSKPKVSHARKTPEGHVKRPPNAFILFRSHCCAPTADPGQLDAPGTPNAQQLQDLGITDHRHISRIVSHLWRSLKPEEKSYWVTRASAKKVEHQQMYPDYRYKPVYRNKDEVKRRRKGDEETRLKEERGCEDVARALLDQPLRSASQEPRDGEGRSSGGESAKPSPAGSDGKKTRRPSPKAEPKTVAIARPAPLTEAAPEAAAEPAVVLAPNKWTIDVVRKALATGEAPPAPDPLPKKKRIRPPRPSRSKIAKAQAAAAAAAEAATNSATSPGGGLDFAVSPAGGEMMLDHATEELLRPYTAQHSDFSGSESYYSSQPSSRAQSPALEAQFNYMAQLDVLQQPHLQHQPQHQQHHYPVDVRPFTSPVHPGRPMTGYDHLSSFAMEPSHSQPQYGFPNSSSGPTQELPYNPPFPYSPPSAVHHQVSSFSMPFPEQGPAIRPLSPQSVALSQQLHHYNITSPPQTANGAPAGGFGARRAGTAPEGLPQGLPISQDEGVVISPTSTTFAYSVAGPGLGDSELGVLPHPGAGLSAARAQAPIEDATPNLSLLGLKRRGTLRGTNGGDLMLISPMTGTFGGRKYSLGRYEVRRFSTQQLAAVAEAENAGAGPGARVRSSLSTELTGPPTADLGMLDFGDAFLNDIMAGNIQPGDGFGAQYLQRTGAGSGEEARPDTAVSSYSVASDASSVDSSGGGAELEGERQVDPDAAVEFWKRQQEHFLGQQQQQQHQIGQDGKPLPTPSYHVAGEDYFVPATPVQPLADYAIHQTGSPPVNLVTGEQTVPVFGSAGFGNFFDPGNHRQSIDALLAASATDHFYAAHYATGAQDWLARGARGSDATIRPMRRESVAHPGVGSAGGMGGGGWQHGFPRAQVLPEGMELRPVYPQDHENPAPYYYLTREESQNAELVAKILACGFGVSYDAEEGDEVAEGGVTVPVVQEGGR